MTATRYRVLDPHAKKIGGLLVDADRTVLLTEAQARYPIDQRQVVEMPKEILPADPVTIAAPAPGTDKRDTRGRKG